MSDMFRGASNFNKIPDQNVEKPNTANVTSMGSMFSSASSFNQPIGNWDTANVTSMSHMFHRASSFNQPIGNWNTANVTDMSGMFAGASSFNQPVENWDISSVEYMTRMFWNASAFNQSISSWDTSRVDEMAAMFAGARSFDQSLGHLNFDAARRNQTSFHDGVACMIDGAGLSVCSYNATLAGWASNPASFSDILIFGVGGLKYTDTASRDALIARGWVISGDVLDTSDPDCTAPEVDANVDSNGSSISGTTEPDATVELKDSEGNVISSMKADASGKFTFMLAAAATNGETFTITAQDAAGNTSDPVSVTAPVIKNEAQTSPGVVSGQTAVADSSSEPVKTGEKPADQDTALASTGINLYTLIGASGLLAGIGFLLARKRG